MIEGESEMRERKVKMRKHGPCRKDGLFGAGQFHV